VFEESGDPANGIGWAMKAGVYGQARHFENGIRDPNPPLIEGGPFGFSKPVDLKLTFEF
jgi:hypothetical protein